MAAPPIGARSIVMSPGSIRRRGNAVAPTHDAINADRLPGADRNATLTTRATPSTLRSQPLTVSAVTSRPNGQTAPSAARRDREAASAASPRRLRASASGSICGAATRCAMTRTSTRRGPITSSALSEWQARHSRRRISPSHSADSSNRSGVGLPSCGPTATQHARTGETPRARRRRAAPARAARRDRQTIAPRLRGRAWSRSAARGERVWRAWPAARARSRVSTPPDVDSLLTPNGPGTPAPSTGRRAAGCPRAPAVTR